MRDSAVFASPRDPQAVVVALNGGERSSDAGRLISLAATDRRDLAVAQIGERRAYAVAKRAFDLAFALLLVILTAPVWIAAAVLVGLTSRGPIIYRQPRCGRQGKTFTCYKFRTMVEGADARRPALLAANEASGPVFKIVRDPRLTRAGRWLRKTSIDELPQLINVLRGDMSIVGPRPPLPGEVACYEPRHLARLAVKPGLTCLWQVSGRSLIGFEEWVRLDLEYIERRCFWFDLLLVARTLPAIVLARGAW